MKRIILSFLIFFYLSIYVNSQIPIENLQLWLYADSVEIINGKVSKWYDLSGNDFHLTQNTDNKRPTQTTSILNNLPVLTFDGNDFLINNPGIIFNQPITVFAIWKTNSADMQTLIDNLAYPNHFLDNSKGLGIRLYALSEVSYSKLNPFDFILTTGVYNFTNSKLYENDILKKTGNVGTESVHGFCIGYRSAFNDRYFNGSVAEIIFYKRELSYNEIVLVWAYLNNKYNLW